jgi:hypothetical protein
LGTSQGHHHPARRDGRGEVEEEMIDDDDFEKTLRAFSDQLEATDPRMADIFRRLREGDMDEQEAMKEIMSFAAEHPEWGEGLHEEAIKAFQPVFEQEITAIEHLPDREEILERWGMTEEDLVYVPDENRMPQLHPLVQGMIAERLQFDGDLPELRTGALPEGGTPAVPIKTASRNPVAIGAMLKKASEEVHAQIMLAQAEQQAALGEALESGNALAVQEVIGRPPVKVEGYEAGKAPALRTVEAPTTQELVSMSFKEKQELFTKALTSTQGRKSAVPVIADMVATKLRESQIPVRLGSKPKTGVDQRSAQWTVEILGSQNEMNPNFSYLDIAARSIARQLVVHYLKKPLHSDNLALFVRPINTVEERIVGWEAALY